MLRVHSLTDPDEVADECADLFGRDPVGCNLLAATLPMRSTVEAIRVEVDDTTVAAAIRWGDGYTLTPAPPDAALAIADALPVDSDIELTAPADVAAAVAGRWSERCNGSYRPVEAMRVYELGELTPPTDTPGSLVVADDTQLERSARWGAAFSAEIDHGDTPLDQARTQFGRAIGQGRVYVWRVDGEPIAHLICSFAAAGAVRLGAVYTPPERRGRGAASALTAAASARLLDDPDVHTVMLNTQAHNAATNRLYRRLGFVAHHELSVLALQRG